MTSLHVIASVATKQSRGSPRSDLLAKSTGDGYTLILQDMPHTINPAVYGKVPYDPLRDFAPITLVARAPQWLFVHPGVAAKSVGDLVALAKAQPGAVKIGSAGNGSGTHLMAELLMRGAGINLTHVPYKGAGPEVTGAAAHPPIVERYKALMLEPATTTPEEFRALIESDLARWGKVVREAGIKAQ